MQVIFYGVGLTSGVLCTGECVGLLTQAPIEAYHSILYTTVYCASYAFCWHVVQMAGHRGALTSKLKFCWSKAAPLSWCLTGHGKDVKATVLFVRVMPTHTS
jgi:hypothetical protein